MASPPIYLARIPPPLGAVAGGRKGGLGCPFESGVSKKKFSGKNFPKKRYLLCVVLVLIYLYIK